MKVPFNGITQQHQAMRGIYNLYNQLDYLTESDNSKISKGFHRRSVSIKVWAGRPFSSLLMLGAENKYNEISTLDVKSEQLAALTAHWNGPGEPINCL